MACMAHRTTILLDEESREAARELAPRWEGGHSEAIGVSGTGGGPPPSPPPWGGGGGGSPALGPPPKGAGGLGGGGPPPRFGVRCCCPETAATLPASPISKSRLCRRRRAPRLSAE